MFIKLTACILDCLGKTRTTRPLYVRPEEIESITEEDNNVTVIELKSGHCWYVVESASAVVEKIIRANKAQLRDIYSFVTPPKTDGNNRSWETEESYDDSLEAYDGDCSESDSEECENYIGDIDEDENCSTCPWNPNCSLVNIITP